jgi:hypothetical protein
MDYLDASFTVEVKSFKAEVDILPNWYLCGNPDHWTALYISGKIIKMYNNMFEYGTWKHEIGEKDQIITLTTKLTKMQAKVKQKVTAFAAQQQSGGNKENNQNSKFDRESHRSKKEPYSVASWRLIKKDDKVTVNGKQYFWAITTAVARSIMACMLITSYVITTLGVKPLMNVVQPKTLANL